MTQLINNLINNEGVRRTPINSVYIVFKISVVLLYYNDCATMLQRIKGSHSLLGVIPT